MVDHHHPLQCAPAVLAGDASVQAQEELVLVPRTKDRLSVHPARPDVVHPERVDGRSPRHTSTVRSFRARRIVWGRNVALLSPWFRERTGLVAPCPKGPRLAARRAVLGGFRDERAEEREVVALLGMP